MRLRQMRYALSGLDPEIRTPPPELVVEPADEESMMTGFVRVRNWEKFQHYKDRNPPWIKLHTELLDNYEFASLQDASKLLAMCTWLLAARSGNKIPHDPAWIQSRCNLKSLPDLKPLIAAGFLEEFIELEECKQDACSLQAESTQSAIPRALARGEAEERQRQIPVGAKTPVGISPDQQATDPRKELWTLGISILGDGARSVIGAAIKRVGEPKVGEILGQMAVRTPAEPKSWFIKATQERGVVC